ncbi:MAG: hypothetical protein AAGA18_07355 [Verrucomicrobiota bacterium]
MLILFAFVLTAFRVSLFASSSITIGGVTVEAGQGVAMCKVPLPEAITKKIKDKKRTHKEVKIGISLPEDFDTSKPQKYLFVAIPVNKPQDLDKGNIHAIKSFQREAGPLGWTVFAIDSDMGYPDGEQFEQITSFGLEVMEEAIPAFSDSIFATAGHSGGAKNSAYSSGAIIKRKYELVGMFMSGCNEDKVGNSQKEFRTGKLGYREVKVFLSSGKKDKIASPMDVKRVAKSLHSNGMKNVRIVSHTGGHGMEKSHISEALEWFDSE